MANGTQYLPTYRSGFTGPSERIGGSSEYHIDLKVLQTLPLQERIRAMDSLAKQYSSIGRDIEFSNERVAGRRWDPTAPLEEKVNLLETAAKAHAPRGGWDSYDFYVPFKGKSRFEPGAVEGASIFIPGVPGGKIRRGSGGNYGFFSESMDPSGRVVFRVGHGDTSRPEADTEIAVGDQPPQAPEGQKQDKSADVLLAEEIKKLIEARQPQLQPSYTGPTEETFRKRREQLDNAVLQMILDKASRQEEAQRMPQQIQSGAGAAAALLAQRGFGTPKSVI